VADYCRYQADAGAQVVQIFDSWASHLSPQDFDVFSGPYIKKVIDSVKATHPNVSTGPRPWRGRHLPPQQLPTR
jgi:uroporphyrinogen decarboxylase